MYTAADLDSRARPVELFLGPYAFGGHTFAVRGARSPVVEVRFASATPVLFETHRLLWCDTGLRVGPGPSRSRRRVASETVSLVQAEGSGLAAFSANTPCRAFMLYLPPTQVIELRQHQCLCAAALRYDEVRAPGGFWLDRFAAGEEPGLLILYSRGEPFEMVLRPEEHLDLQPEALLYKEPAVTLATVEPQEAGAPGAVPRNRHLLRCSGPGLIAVQTAGPSALEA